MPNTSTNEQENRLAAFLYKFENRTIIGGPGKKKFWFVLSLDSPYLYWYKNSEDLNCVGRLLLTGAAFTFDPRQIGRFEIHVNEEIHILEGPDNKCRIKWLQMLQKNRKRHYESENVDELLNSVKMSKKIENSIQEIVSLSSSRSTLLSEHGQKSPKASSSTEGENVTLFEEISASQKLTQEQTNAGKENSDIKNSIFYLNSDGALNRKSLEIPESVQTNMVIKTADEIFGKIAEESQRVRNLEEASKKVLGKARASFRMPSFSEKKNCEQCKDLIKMVEKLNNQCYDLTDEISAQSQLIDVLRQSLISAHNQRDALKKLENATDSEKLDFTLERESAITALQLLNAELKIANQTLKDQIRKVESKNESLLASEEAFRESVRTKDEIIVKICEQQSDLELKVLQKPATLDVYDFDVPEGILVDLGTSPDDGSQRVFDETEVNDITELRDTVEGYKNQNVFLNMEILELQKIVHSLEERERKLVRQNFDIEACYYQLKSRYMMVLNHFKSDTPRKPLEPSVIQELIDDVNQHQLRKISSRLEDRDRDSMVDELGFYLSKNQHGSNQIHSTSRADADSTTDQMVTKAADMKKRSDDILYNIQMEQNKDYLDWLQKWDSFLVNHVLQPINQSNELKVLVRTGIPSTYRARVWKRLVSFLVSNTMADMGKGYYEMLTRRAAKVAESDKPDDSLRQIELDLGRTLPTNMHFKDMSSQKMKSLKNVLSAFRFHNKAVEYCQGLNRIAAIGLLYLKEPDAFWFLAAIVDHLQPPYYYSSKLIGAQADQKVFLDLVQEKMPKLWNHFKELEIDLSLFTFSWFLTIFVDTLSHNLYLNIFDVFLYEGNKVLFRFALALLKVSEPKILECSSVGAIHACLSNMSDLLVDYKTLARIAFNQLNPFPLKSIETKRLYYLNQLKEKMLK